jgi:hypothetical protein
METSRFTSAPREEELAAIFREEVPGRRRRFYIIVDCADRIADGVWVLAILVSSYSRHAGLNIFSSRSRGDYTIPTPTVEITLETGRGGISLVSADSLKDISAVVSAHGTDAREEVESK